MEDQFAPGVPQQAHNLFFWSLLAFCFYIGGPEAAPCPNSHKIWSLSPATTTRKKPHQQNMYVEIERKGQWHFKTVTCDWRYICDNLVGKGVCQVRCPSTDLDTDDKEVSGGGVLSCLKAMEAQELNKGVY